MMTIATSDSWRVVRSFVRSKKKKLPPGAAVELREALTLVAEDIVAMMDMCEQNLGDEGLELLHLEEGGLCAQHYAVGCASGAEFCIPYIRGVRLLASLAFCTDSADMRDMRESLENDPDLRAAEIISSLDTCDIRGRGK